VLGMGAEGEYEREREARVRRNRRRLAELVPAGAGPPRGGGGRRPRKRGGARDPAAATAGPSGPARRSRRLEGRPAGEFLTYFADDEEAGGRLRRGTSEVSEAQRRRAPPAGPRPPPPPPAPDSCRALDADVQGLQESWVGVQVVPLDGGGGMKAAAMARIRGAPPFTRPPRFSKYSGIQEWRNAVALFVNVSGKTGAVYDNVFSGGGGQMAWFAQRFHTEESPVIVKMLGKAAVPVVLFVRREGEAYVYCGRLTPGEVFPEHQPLKVIWNLEDIATLRRSVPLQDLLGPEVLKELKNAGTRGEG